MNDKTAKPATYTAFEDFTFKYNRKTYSGKKGEPFTPPEDYQEIGSEPDMRNINKRSTPLGIKFQYPTYIKTVNEEKGEETELEIPHFMTLPLTRS